jgi:isocitrate dehydrogenase kinase/phosphatase
MSIFRRRGRFDEVIRRQLDLFEQDHLEVIEEVVDRLDTYNSADRDDAEDLYGAYVDAVETATELLADIRDAYARLLEEGIDEAYEEEFNRAVLKRWPPFASEIDLR